MGFSARGAAQESRVANLLLVLSVSELLQHRAQFGSDPAELLPVSRGKILQDLLPSGRERDEDLTPIGFGDFAEDEMLRLQAIDQADRAVMGHLETLCEFADGNAVPTGETFDREEGLMLLRRDPGRMSGVLAETQKLAQRKPERGQRLVLGFGELSGASHGAQHDSPSKAGRGFA